MTNKIHGYSGARALTRRTALKSALGATLAGSGFGIIGKASAAAVTMRFGSDSPMASPHTKSAVVFKEIVEKNTQGRVQVDIFPDGQLGANAAMTNAVKAGTLDAVVTDVSHISVAVPQADVFNLPFMFKDTDAVLRFANGPVGTALKPKIEDAFACDLLGYASDGARNLWNNVRPIKTPADMNGMKFGIQSSKIQRDTILAFGGIPTVVSFNALYTALQTGLVDGADKTFADIIQVKFYQVSKYLTFTSHYSIVNVMIASKKFMEKLTPADQDVVRAAGKPSVDAHVADIKAAEKEAVAFLTEKGMQFFQMEDPKAFSAKLDAVYKEAGERIGLDLIDQARKTS